MTQSKNFWVIPTDKPSRLHYYEFNVIGLSKDYFNWRQGRNLYITNDDKFTSSQDWFMDIKDNRNHLHQIGYDLESVEWNDQYNPLYYKKVILTTDQDLIKDGVQQIDDHFLEWFVKNPSCEKVDVNKSYGGTYYIAYPYKIIIPKKEPKQDKIMERFIANAKQETIEEVLLFKNDAQAIRFMEKYYQAKKEEDERNY